MNTITPRQEFTPTGQIAAGIFSNTIASTIMQPGFVCKTYIQNGQGLPPAHALFRGLIPNLIGGGFLQAVAFSANSLSQKYFPGSKTFMQSLAISLTSGAVGAQVATMAERVMIIQQVHGGSVNKIIRSIISQEGLKGLFKGNVATMGRESLYITGIFTSTDFISSRLKPAIASDSKRQLAASLISGALVGFVTNPLDKIKTMMQADIKNEHSSFIKTADKIIKKAGASGLFNGAFARMITIAGLTCALVEVKGFFPKIAPQVFFQN